MFYSRLPVYWNSGMIVTVRCNKDVFFGQMLYCPPPHTPRTHPGGAVIDRVRVARRSSGCVCRNSWLRRSCDCAPRAQLSSRERTDGTLTAALLIVGGEWPSPRGPGAGSTGRRSTEPCGRFRRGTGTWSRSEPELMGPCGEFGLLLQLHQNQTQLSFHVHNSSEI